MKSTVLLVACLSAITTFFSSSPQHSNFRNSHASTANQIRALINKQGSGPQTLQSETRKKRSMRPFGAVEGNKIKKRSATASLQVRDGSTDGYSTSSDSSKKRKRRKHPKHHNSSFSSNYSTSSNTSDTSGSANTSKLASDYAKPDSSSDSVSVSVGSSVGVSVSTDTFSGTATFFSQGGVAGACGTVHKDSDYVVAIQTAMYKGGQYCGKKITITRTSTGKSIQAVAADECPGCRTAQSLDLSIGAFDALGSPDEGVFEMTWTASS
eukprot:GHVU01109628.1.p1 GENE.GHVU01109628.1~~GHVU01109628.1.p1  ORF type:complete len:283 (-),score=16.44 GHVU01109628.1:146-946(-)